MEKKELIQKLKKKKLKEVLVFVDGLYMPIENVTTYDNYIVLKIRDIRKVGK